MQRERIQSFLYKNDPSTHGEETGRDALDWCIHLLMKGAWRQAYDVVALFILIEQDFGLAHLDKIFKRLVTIIMFIKTWVDIQQSFFHKAHVHHFDIGLDTDLADHLHNLLDRVEFCHRGRGESVGGCGRGGCGGDGGGGGRFEGMKIFEDDKL